MSKQRKYEKLGKVDLSPEVSAEFERKIAEADKELDEARVNFRWGKEQVDLVKKVAFMLGVPYQTYIKEAVFRSCQADLKNFCETQTLAANLARKS